MHDKLKTLHNNSSSDVPLTPKGGQRGLLCSNKKSDRCSPLGVKPSTIFSEEALDNFMGFAKILKQIHIRLLTEGYIIKDGQIYKP